MGKQIIHSEIESKFLYRIVATIDTINYGIPFLFYHSIQAISIEYWNQCDFYSVKKCVITSIDNKSFQKETTIAITRLTIAIAMLDGGTKRHFSKSFFKSETILARHLKVLISSNSRRIFGRSVSHVVTLVVPNFSSLRRGLVENKPQLFSLFYP